MARTVTGADIGLRTAKFLRGAWKGNTFHATDFAVVEHGGGGDVAGAWERCELGFKPRDARIGLTGRDVNIRYTRVPQVPDWQLRKLMRFEVAEIGEQSGSEVASDFNLLPNLPELEGEDVVLLAMARENLLEAHLAGLAAIGGTLDGFSPNALALYNAWTHFGAVEEETVLIASLGHENLDVILVRGPDLIFARNLTGGARMFDDAIAERLGVSAQKAEELKIEIADLEPGAHYRDANQEKTSRACLGAAGQLLSLLQSTVMFCKSQVKVTNLRVDRVLLCGGGAALKGLPRYLSSGLGVPVELFDPFRVVDTTALAPESAERLEHYRLEAVVALGLATMASDPAGYSVEILPARLRARREFLGGTAFLIAAAVLAALFLGYETWSLGSRKGTVESEVSQLEARLRRATSTDRRVRELLEENERLAEAGTELQGVAGAGEQIARVLDGLQRVLPDGFWIEALSSDWRSDDRLRITREVPQPTVSLVGRAQEGTESIASQMNTFVTRLQEALPGAELVYQPSPSGDRFTLDLTLFAPPRPAEPEAEGDAGTDGEGEEG
ncbi:MAG TPA: pilus assembly protein PilM [Planctomycetota bacterium]|nr:pilus assembly protein PilM [Planctomycetota bacterium]